MQKIKSNLKWLLDELNFNILKIRTKPRTLQLPVTSKCNSKCITCNIWRQQEKHDIDCLKLKEVLKDRFFSEIRGVGVNGGEPGLLSNPMELFEALLSLKKLSAVTIISNGVIPEKTLTLLRVAKKFFKSRNIKVGFQLSIDGYGDIDSKVRGVPNAYNSAIDIVKTVKANLSEYCDNFSIICTISGANVGYLAQFEQAMQEYSCEIYYHLAVPNRRIGTFDCADYSVLNDEQSRLLAAEFFLHKYFQTKKISYWGIYNYLYNRGCGRNFHCSWLLRDVTIDENLDLYLCASASDKIGSLLEKSAASLIKSANLKRVERCTNKYCNSCIHYAWSISCRGYIQFIKWRLINNTKVFNLFKLMR